MSLCFKIVFVAMVATIGAGAAQDAANSQPAQPAQPAQDQESYSLPGREDFEDAAQGEEQGRDAPTLLASQSSDEYAGFGARRVGDIPWIDIDAQHQLHSRVSTEAKNFGRTSAPWVLTPVPPIAVSGGGSVPSLFSFSCWSIATATARRALASRFFFFRRLLPRPIGAGAGKRRLLPCRAPSTQTR
jgi:hypothetical protein